MNLKFDERKIRKTLKETSRDKSNKQYLLEDQREVLDFDEISRQIAQQVRLGTKAKSCDALYIGSKYIYLIEFKNQKVSDLKRDKPNLHEKAYDSIFQLQLYLDSLDRPMYLTDLVNITRLIVIYNDSKLCVDSKTNISSSASMSKIIKKMKEFSKHEPLDTFPKQFGLDGLEGKLYEKVMTIDIKDFDEDVKSIVFQ